MNVTEPDTVKTAPPRRFISYSWSDQLTNRDQRLQGLFDCIGTGSKLANFQLPGLEEFDVTQALCFLTRPRAERRDEQYR